MKYIKSTFRASMAEIFRDDVSFFVPNAIESAIKHERENVTTHCIRISEEFRDNGAEKTI